MALVFFRREFLQAGTRARKFVLPALIVYAFQMVWVRSIELTTPTTAVLLSKLDVISIALLSAIFFAAERKIVKNRFFLVGCALALLGVAGVALGKDAPSTEFNEGIGLLLLRSVLWAVYIVSIRALVEEEEPLIIATWIYLFASILFVPTAYIWGDIAKVTEVPPTTNIMLIGSGALCVGLGNALNFLVIKHLGSTLSATLLLVTPFTAGILAYLVCDETLTAIQILSGVVIVLSCLLIVRKVVAQKSAD